MNKLNNLISFSLILLIKVLPILGDAEKLSDLVSLTNNGPNDVIFIMDRSTSVENTLFYRNNRRITESLIQNFIPAGNISRISAITFGRDVTVDFDYISLDNNEIRPTKCEMQADFNKLKFKSADEYAKGFNISGALNLAAGVLRRGRENRANVTQIIVLMSDGDYNKEQDPKIIVENLEKENVLIFVIGIGWWLEVGNMRTLASKDEYYGEEDQWMNFVESNNSFEYFKNFPTNYEPLRNNSNLVCNLLKSEIKNKSDIALSMRKDNCSSILCSNGGKCVTTFDSFICICQWGFYGEFCDKEVNLCLYDTLCENNGTCSIHKRDRRKGFMCDCKSGTNGYKCSNIIKKPTTKRTTIITEKTSKLKPIGEDTPPPPVVTEKTAGKGFPYGPVIGTVCGVLLLLLIVAFVVIFLIVRRRKIQNGDNKPIVIKKEMMTETDAMENGLYANKKLPDKEDPSVPPMRQESLIDENTYESLESVNTVSEAVYEADIMYACMKNWQKYIDELVTQERVSKAALIKKDFSKQATSKNFLINLGEIYQLLDLVEKSYDESLITVQGKEYELLDQHNIIITGLAVDKSTSFAVAQTNCFIVIAISKYPDQEKNDKKEVEWIQKHVLEEGF